MRALIIFILLCFALPAYSDAINGGVEKRDLRGTNQVVDSTSGSGIPYAQVTMPSKRFKTITDEEGRFDLKTNISAPTIMSIRKDGYRPYSLTISDQSASKPIVVGIEKSTPKDVVIDCDMVHLGDDSFCADSANSGDFAAKSSGAFYSKDFMIKSIKPTENAYLVIGSIIGIDTVMARELGQSKVSTAYASPPQVFINGNKVAEIKINGDSQEIKIPKSLVSQYQRNEITIKAGKNLLQSAYIDYDDIEFMNILLEVK